MTRPNIPPPLDVAHTMPAHVVFGPLNYAHPTEEYVGGVRVRPLSSWLSPQSSFPERGIARLTARSAVLSYEYAFEEVADLAKEAPDSGVVLPDSGYAAELDDDTRRQLLGRISDFIAENRCTKGGERHLVAVMELAERRSGDERFAGKIAAVLHDLRYGTVNNSEWHQIMPILRGRSGHVGRLPEGYELGYIGWLNPRDSAERFGVRGLPRITKGYARLILGGSALPDSKK